MSTPVVRVELVVVPRGRGVTGSHDLCDIYHVARFQPMNAIVLQLRAIKVREKEKNPSLNEQFIVNL